MEGTKDHQPGGEAGGTPRRDAEATSGETLSDIEESEKVKGTPARTSPSGPITPATFARGGGRRNG